MRRIRPERCAVVAGWTLLVLALVISPSGTVTLPAPEPTPSVSLLYASSGSLPQLLNTGQIDAALIWEPVVANAELSGIGTRIAVPAEIPPPGKWEDAAINVLVLRRDIVQQYPDVAALLSALTTAAIERTNDEIPMAENITAAWVFGKNSILTPHDTLAPLAIEQRSFQNMVFTADADPPEFAVVQHAVESKYGGNATFDPMAWVDPSVAALGARFLNGSAVPRIGADVPTLDIGYLPSSDNYAPVYVMVKDSEWFCDRYGFCLAPDDPSLSRPVKCTLLVNGTPAAHVNLQMGQSGGGIMTTIGQKALDGAYIGSFPAESQIALGNPCVMVQSINTGGSGLIVANGSALRDWSDFVGWAKARSAGGRPVVIATVQSSIQEDMVREACAYENLTVTLYGTGFTA